MLQQGHRRVGRGMNERRLKHAATGFAAVLLLVFLRSGVLQPPHRSVGRGMNERRLKHAATGFAAVLLLCFFT